MSHDITSAANERIKWLVRLRERKHRDATRMFPVEGERLYQRALAAGLRPEVTFVTQPSPQTVGEVITVAPDVLDKASYRRRSQGIIGVFPQLGTRLDDLDPGEEPLLLIMDDVEKPGNLGAMLRTAAAAGVRGVLTVGSTVDVHNPNVLRASTGAIFTVPIAVTRWEQAAPWLEGRRIRTVAATPGAATPYWDADLTGPLALVIGAEDAGLSAAAAAAADALVTIPQSHEGVDSLNASVAAAVVLFEAVRQRVSTG